MKLSLPCSTEQKSGQCSLLLFFFFPGMLEKWRRLVPNGPVVVVVVALLHVSELTYINSARSGQNLDQDLSP